MRSTKRRIIKKSIKLQPAAKQLPSSEQHSMLVDFLQEHPTLATCTLTDVPQRDIVRRSWNDLSVKLNHLGTHCSPDQWRRIWKDMKHEVQSKLAHNTHRKKNKLDNLNDHELRIANILLKKSGRSSTYMCKCKRSSTASSEGDSEESFNNNASVELGSDDVSIEKDGYTENNEQYFSHPQITDTQEESQMSISKSLQDICQQNSEILQHVRQTYNLMAEDSKRQQAYQSSKLLIYRKKLELLQTKLEMDKITSFSNINI